LPAFFYISRPGRFSVVIAHVLLDRFDIIEQDMRCDQALSTILYENYGVLTQDSSLILQ